MMTKLIFIIMMLIITVIIVEVRFSMARAYYSLCVDNTKKYCSEQITARYQPEWVSEYFPSYFSISTVSLLRSIQSSSTVESSKASFFFEGIKKR